MLYCYPGSGQALGLRIPQRYLLPGFILSHPSPEEDRRETSLSLLDINGLLSWLKHRNFEINRPARLWSENEGTKTSFSPQCNSSTFYTGRDVLSVSAVTTRKRWRKFNRVNPFPFVVINRVLPPGIVCIDRDRHL